MNDYEKYQAKTNIKTWAEEDRPREKLRDKGKLSLSKGELIAILIGSGNRQESAVALSHRILDGSDNNLNELGKRTIDELSNFKGIGEAKAISIIAALELGRRRQLSNVLERPQIKSSKDAYNVIAPLLVDLYHEEFWILILNRANKVYRKERISKGGVAGTVVDIKIVFKKALEYGVPSSIILCHNHPSGSLNPSEADIRVTKKIKKAGEFLEIAVLDHLIVSENGYYSFADEGML